MDLIRIIILTMMLCHLAPVATAAAPQSETEAEDLVNEGIQLIIQKEPLKAIGNFEKVLFAYPDNAPTQYYTAMALGALGEIDSAISFYNMAVENGYRGQNGEDIVGDLLKQYEPREFDVEYFSPQQGFQKIHIKGSPGGEDELIRDTIAQIDKMKMVFGISDIREISVRFLRWIDADVFYERWTVLLGGGDVDIWVTFNTNPPADAPFKTQITISDTDDHPAREEVSNLARVLSTETSPAMINQKMPVVQDQQVQTNVLSSSQITDLEKARTLVAVGDCFQAMPILETILKTDPANYEAYLGRAACHYSDTKDYAMAIKDYFKVLEIRPEATEVYKSIATVYLAQKNQAQAILTFQQYLQYYPDDGEAWYALAWVTKRAEDLWRAEQLGIKDTLGLRDVIQEEEIKKIENAFKELEKKDSGWILGQNADWILAGIKTMVGLIVLFGIGLLKIFFTPAATVGPTLREDLKVSLKKMHRFVALIFIGATIFNLIFVNFLDVEHVWLGILGVYIFCAILAAFFYGALIIASYKAGNN